MDKTTRASRRRLWTGALTAVVALWALGWVMIGNAAPGEALAPVARPIPEARLIHAKELAEALAGPAAQRPAVLHVGYHVLYRGGHIAGSRYIGPASKPEGLQALREGAVRKLPRAKPIVLYCGCCPWTDCPNMRPAYAAVESTGRTVKILYIAKNLQKDWIDAGLPTESEDR